MEKKWKGKVSKGTCQMTLGYLADGYRILEEVPLDAFPYHKVWVVFTFFNRAFSPDFLGGYPKNVYLCEWFRASFS